MPFATPYGPQPFTLTDLQRVGVSEDGLRNLHRTGEVRRVLRGVYVDAAVPESPTLRAAAASRVAPPGEVLCCRTAAWLWGVDATAMGAHLTVPPVDLMAPGTAAPRRAGCRGRTGRLPHSDVVQLHGVLLTTPARTAADLGRLLRRPDALAAYDAMLRGVAGLTADGVREVLVRFGRARGVVQARELISLADPRAESPQESRTRLRIIDAGLPCPEPQIEVFDHDGNVIARLDMGYRALLKAVEFDGDVAHATLAQQRHDQARRARVEARGWSVVAVTRAQVQGRGLAFERAVGGLLGVEPHLTKHHPRYGGWDRRVPGGL